MFTGLERPRAAGRPAIHYEGWTKVGALPVRELIPSILWFFVKLGLFAVAVLVVARNVYRNIRFD